MRSSGSTIVDQATVIVLDDQCDRSAIESMIRLLERKFRNVTVLIAGSKLSADADLTANDQIYFMSVDKSTHRFDLHEVMKRAVEVAPESARFFIFEGERVARFSEKDLKTVVKNQPDFAKLAKGTYFMSKRYLLHVLETGDAPSAANAIKSGYSSEMSVSEMLRSPKEAIRQYSTVVSFALVGASGVGVNLLVLTIFKSLVGALLANAIAQEVSIASNFIWNDRFTFQSRSKVSRFLELPRLYRFVKYNLVSLLSFTVNEAVFFLAYSHGIFYIYSSLIAIATAFMVNYFGSSRWAWAKTALQLAKD